MKLQRQANVNVMTASLIWGLLLNLGILGARRFIATDLPLDILWYAGNVLALALYPWLVSTILRRKVGLWVNALLFSAVGSFLAGTGMFVFAAFQDNAWVNAGIGLLGLWAFSRLGLPAFERVTAIRREWASPLWRRLNDSSLAEFLFLRFSSLNDLAKR